MWGSKGILPDGINQGILGDCWLLCAFSALAEWPDRLKKVITNNEYSPEGIFEFNFFNAGNKEKVVIDDRLPYEDGVDYGSYYTLGQLSFTKKSSNGAYWVPLIEKAAAKFYGSFSNMSGGNTAESLYMLTGMPTRSIYSVETTGDKLWDTVHDANARQWIMAAGNQIPKYGLPGGHAYSLIHTHKLADGTKLLKLRNPWGTEVYTGPYSDAKLTEAQKTELNHTAGDDGYFWIDMPTFTEVFSSSSIAMYENWVVSKLDHTWDRTEANRGNWKVVNSAAQDVVIGVEMMSERMFPTSNCDTPQMPDQVPFQLKDSTGNIVSDRYGSDWSVTMDQTGRGYLFFENLPEGTFTMEQVRYGAQPYHTGNLNFKVVSYGLTAGAYLYAK